MARAPFLDKFLEGNRRRRQGDARDSVAHVIRNIQALLNTKEGYGSFVRGFGLGGYTEKAGTRDLVVALLEEMKGEISRHEPRISQLDLKLRGQDATLWLHFDLTCVIAGERVKLRLLFDTTTAEVRVTEAP